MTMLTFTQFSATIPAVHRRLLPVANGQNAVNCHMEDGKLNALFKPKRVGIANNNPPESIFLQRNGFGWLDWNTDVDVLRGPLETDGYPDTLIYTGDGRPQIRAEGSTTHYDLGLPAPIDAPSAVAEANAQSGDVSSVSRIIYDTFKSYSGSGAEEDRNHYEGLGPDIKQLTCVVTDDLSVNIKVHMDLSFIAPTNLSSSSPIGLLLFRDPLDIPAIYAAAVAGTTLPEQPVGTRSYTFDLAHLGTYLYFTIDDSFIDTPSNGTHTYLLIWRNESYGDFEANVRPSLSPPVSQIYGFGLIWDLEARVNNRTKVTSVEDTNLTAGASVTFLDIVGTGTLPNAMNGKVFNVVTIDDSKTFEIEALIEGGYTSGGTWSQYFSTSSLETRAYRYTYVATINGVDYEGPGSLASDTVDAGDGQSVVVSGFSSFPVDWNSPANRIRLYRYAAASSTTGTYQFVAEFDINTSSYTDTVAGIALGESIPDPDREPPPETLTGIVELPNGGAAGFTGKSVYLAEPNYLHAWPPAYARNAHDDVVAIGSFGGSLAIATKSQPYVLTGTDPTTMTMDKIELNQPCLSKRGCVDFGYMWLYPAPDGAVAISVGRAEVITLPLFNESQWKELNPSSFVAASYENKYVCFYEKTDGTKGGFLFFPMYLDRGVVWLDFWADAVWTDQTDGKLYIAQGTLIKQFDADLVEMDMAWRSKEFSTPEVTMTVGRVEAAKYPVFMSVFCDDVEVASVQVYSRNAFRIGQPKGKSWSVEVRGQHPIEAIFLAENMQELGGFPGGS